MLVRLERESAQCCTPKSRDKVNEGPKSTKLRLKRVDYVRWLVGKGVKAQTGSHALTSQRFLLGQRLSIASTQEVRRPEQRGAFKVRNRV